MTTLAPARPPSAHPRAGRATLPATASRLPLVVTVAVLVAALAGAVLAGQQLVARGGDRLPGEVPVSFGGAVVGAATPAKATPAAASHGMTSDAPTAADGRRVVVPVTLVNRSTGVVGYRGEQFRLSVPGVADPATPGENPLATGSLHPGAAVSLRLVFSVPVGATSARLALDPGDPTRAVDVALPSGGTPAPAPATAEPPAAGAHTAH